MALIADYGDLKSAVSIWLRGDASLEASADAFIALFEAEFVSDPEMRTFEMEEIDTATIPSGPMPLPDGFLEAIRFKVVGANGTRDQVLDYESPQAAAIRDARAQTSTGSTGTCKHYTILAGQIVLSPQAWAPVGSTMELAYYKFAPLATAAGGANWLLTKYPNIYLYGSLMQAANFVDDDVVVKWAASLTAAMAKLAKSDRKRKSTAGPLVMGPSTGFIR